MMVCPNCVDSCSHTTRATTSAMLPGATGTIALSGFVGHVSASALIVATVRPSANTSIKSIGFIGFLLATHWLLA
jgi:hypothetical protein